MDELKRFKNFDLITKQAGNEKQEINDSKQFESFMNKFGSYGKHYENAKLKEKLQQNITV